MDAHVEIIKLIIAYALTGSFVFTLVVTCLSLINIVKSIDKKLKRKLINVLVVEVAVIAVGSFSNILNLDPAKASNIIRKEGREEERTKIANMLIEEIAPGGNLSGLEISSRASRAEVLNTLSTVKKISPEKAGPRADSLINYINRAPTNFTTKTDSANFARDVANHLTKIREGLKSQELKRPLKIDRK